MTVFYTIDDLKNLDTVYKIMKTYTTRENCIFCKETLKMTYFTKDYECFSGHYMVPLYYDSKSMHKIPYNIYICELCKTVQTKYLGDLNEIYKFNHVDNTGRIWNQLHILVSEMISKYQKHIHNIIEIGGSGGVLADYILKKIVTDYYIIEPSYWGDRHDKKHIIPDFYENVDDTTINANTIIMSHVFEHFYEPMKILEKISNNTNIRYLFLILPDLEYAINNQILNVLNTEHTFYIDNIFLINLLDVYGFHLVEKQNHENHSILFYFEKRYPTRVNTSITFVNHHYSLETYFNPVFDKIKSITKIVEHEKYENVYIWPASVHTILLFVLGLDETIITALLDNSKMKIGSKQYGTNLPILSMSEKMNENCLIFLNGGVFNSEINTDSCVATVIIL